MQLLRSLALILAVSIPVASADTKAAPTTRPAEKQTFTRVPDATPITATAALPALTLTATGPIGRRRATGPNLSQTKEPSQNPIVAAVGDHVFVVWEELANGRRTLQIAHSPDGGRSFGAAFNATDPANDASAAQLVIANNLLHLFWLETRGGGAYVMHATSPLEALAFDKTEQVSKGGQARGAIVATATGSEVLVAWTESAGTASILFEQAIGGKRNVVATATAIDQLALAATAQRIVIAYRAPAEAANATDLDVFLAHSTNKGASWTKNRMSGDYGEQGSNALIANDRFYWAYESTNYPRGGAAVRAFVDPELNTREQSWALRLVDSVPGGSPALNLRLTPRLAAGTEGRCHVVTFAIESTSARTNTFAARVWYTDLENRRYSESVSALASSLGIAVNSADQALVVWSDGPNSGDTDIWAFDAVRRQKYNVSSTPGARSSDARVVATASGYVVVWTEVAAANTETFVRAIAKP